MPRMTTTPSKLGVVRLVPIGSLQPREDNPRRRLSQDALDHLARQLDADPDFMRARPIVADPDGRIIGGAQRWRALQQLGRKRVWAVHLDGDAALQAERMIRDNVHTGDWDAALLRDLIDTHDVDTTGAGLSDEELQRLLQTAADAPTAPPAAPRPTLTDRFIVPPFTVLDVRQGYWQERKRQWNATGINAGDIGRDAHLAYAGQESLNAIQQQGKGLVLQSLSGIEPDYYRQKEAAEAALGRELSLQEFEADHLVIGDGVNLSTTGTSFFDPVLAELSYRWFAPDGGSVLDPFAGESTKGLVAAMLGYPYTGIELRPEQVAANEAQAAAFPDLPQQPRWITGDAATLDAHLPGGELYDLVFTSPPYYDLEVYSGRGDDASAMPTYAEFMDFYRDVFTQAVARLRDDRFLVIKVGEIRDPRGAYRGFVPDNVRLFVDLGLTFHNEAVLVTPVGSLPVRAARAFAAGRKLGKTHQTILTFYKGDLRSVGKHFSQTIDVASAAGTTDAEPES